MKYTQHWGVQNVYAADATLRCVYEVYLTLGAYIQCTEHCVLLTRNCNIREVAKST